MLNQTHSTVVAVFRNGADAQSAANELRNSGFQSSDIFISSESHADASYARAETGTSSTSTNQHHEGGITGWFKSIFGEGQDDERSYNDQPYYENAVSGGNVVLSVDVTDENINRAAEILNSHSPVDVHSEGSDMAGETATGTGYASTSGSASTSAPATTTGRTTAGTASNVANAAESQAIPVVREELQVGKRAVLKGGVRVYSRLVEEPVQESVNLHEEKVRVERTPTNRPISGADLRSGQEQVIEVKEYAEEAVVAKQARVVEEVRVTKEATDRAETIRDTVRHTEVRVEDVPAGTTGAGTGASASGTTGSGVNDTDFRRHFEQTYGTTGDYNNYRPAYDYGYQMSSDPRFKGRSFEESESQLREDYGRRYPGGTWDKMKDSVRYGWNKLTNKV